MLNRRRFSPPFYSSFSFVCARGSAHTDSIRQWSRITTKYNASVLPKLVRLYFVQTENHRIKFFRSISSLFSTSIVSGCFAIGKKKNTHKINFRNDREWHECWGIDAEYSMYFWSNTMPLRVRLTLYDRKIQWKLNGETNLWIDGEIFDARKFTRMAKPVCVCEAQSNTYAFLLFETGMDVVCARFCHIPISNAIKSGSTWLIKS